MSAPPNSYRGLLIPFDGMLTEINALQKCAARFLTRDSTAKVLDTWKSGLRAFRDSDRSETRWAIPRDRPITTVPSTDYDRKSGREIHATLSCVWDLRKVETQRKGKTIKWSNGEFLLKGQAVTRVCLFERFNSKVKELGCWSFEIGDGHQGAHFHTQIKVGDDPPFPTWLSVPRLPTLIVTPMDALEFVLSELFQARWREHLAHRNGDVGRWDVEQRARMKSLLNWHIELVSGSGATAWNRIKTALPRDNLLFGTT